MFGGTEIAATAELDMERTPTATQGGFGTGLADVNTTSSVEPVKLPVRNEGSVSMDISMEGKYCPRSAFTPWEFLIQRALSFYPSLPAFPPATKETTSNLDSNQVGLQTGLRPYHSKPTAVTTIPPKPASRNAPPTRSDLSPIKTTATTTTSRESQKEAFTNATFAKEPSDAVQPSAAITQMNYQHQLTLANDQIAKLERALQEKDVVLHRVFTSLEREKQANAEALSSVETERQLRETVDADTKALRALRDSIQSDLDKERKAKKMLEMDLQSKRESMEKSNAKVQEFLTENHQLRLQITDLESKIITHDSTLSDQQASKSVMMDKLRIAQDKLSTENDILRRKLDVANNEIEDLKKSQSNSTQEGSDRVKRLEEENLRCRRRVDETRQEYDKLVNQVHDIREGMVRETESLKQTIQEKSTKIRELELKLLEAVKNTSAITTYMHQLEETEAALRRAETTGEKDQAKIVELEQQLTTMHDREKSIFQDERVKTAKAELALQQIKKTVHELSSKMADYEKLIENQQREIKTLQGECGQHKVEVVTVEKKYMELVSEHKLLKEYYVIKNGDANQQAETSSSVVIPGGATANASASTTAANTKEEDTWKKEAEHWKNKYIESCIKVTDLIRSKRNLMYELGTSQQNHQQAIHQLSDHTQR